MRTLTAFMLLLALGSTALVNRAGAAVFRDKTAEAGLSITYIPECSLGTGPGAAFGDWDNDGDMDLYLGRDGQGDLLLRNDGSGHFQDVTGSFLSISNPGWANGIAWGDVDRDGDLDLYVANENIQNVFYKNLLTETGVPNLVDATAEFWLVEARVKNSKGVSFADVNLDGRLDLYVANYDQGGNYLYIQRTDGRFVESGVSLGVADEGFGFMGIFTDYDHDGDPDLYVVNDFSQFFDINRLYKNMLKETGALRFVNVTNLSGDLANDKGMGMGVAVGDYDNDGNLDIYVTNLGINTLYRNNGNGTFDDVTRQAGVEGSLERVSWGTAFLDFDNDRDFDLFSVNGFIYDKAVGFPPQGDEFFRSNGDGTYSDYTFPSNFGSDLEGRAAACADIDMDGDLDVLVTCNARLPVPGWTEPILYENQGGNVLSWIGVRLFGVASNPQGIGARVTVTAGGVSRVQEVHGGSSYLSQHSTWLLFGLALNTTVGEIKVEWPSGTVDVANGIPARRYVSIVEGDGPVAVALETYTVRYAEGRVRADWSVHRDRTLVGFSLDRRAEGAERFATLAGPGALPATVRGVHSFEDVEVRPGRAYEYRLRARYDDGRDEILALRSIRIPAGSLSLAQNVPNPFNPSTVIRFHLGEPGPVRLAVYDGAGRRVRSLLSAHREAGEYAVTWDGRDDQGGRLPSGVYYYRLAAGKTSRTRKMVLLK